MKTQVETSEAGAARQSFVRVCAAPSLRVPVTAANRALLRQLRAAELSAWEAGHLCSRNPPTASSTLLADQQL